MKNNRNTSKNPRPTLLDRPHPDGYSQEWLESLKNDPSKNENEGISIVIFRIFNTYFGIATKSIQEIREFSPIHKIPHKTNKVLLGLTNIQGTLKLTISLHMLLGIEKTTSISQNNKIYQRILSLGSNKNDFVFVADEVFGVHSIDNDNIKPISENTAKDLTPFCSGQFQHNEHTVHLLNGSDLINCINKNYL